MDKYHRCPFFCIFWMHLWMDLCGKVFILSYLAKNFGRHLMLQNFLIKAVVQFSTESLGGEGRGGMVYVINVEFISLCTLTTTGILELRNLK